MSNTPTIILPDNPPVFLTAGIATLDGTIPVENLPVGQGADQVAAGDDPRFPVSPTAVPSLRHEVWIAPDRNDNRPGDGTLANPYDGSTQPKFDAIMTDNTKTPPNTVIHLLPGTFTTKGIAYNPNNVTNPAGVLLKDGWIIRGAGLDLTKLFLQPIPAAGYARHFGPLPASLNHVEIRDLTLDGNVQSQPNGTLMQADIACAHGGYYGVRLTNWGNANGGAQEAFGLVCSVSGISGKAHPEVRDCVVDAPPYYGGSSLGVNAEASANLETAGLLDNNTIYDNFSSNGVALAGCFNGLLATRNHVVRAARGFHQDTAPIPTSGFISENVRIEGNFFEACQVLVGLGSAGNSLIHNYVIADNTGTGTGYQPNAAGYGNFTPFFIDSGVTGITVAGNRVGFSAADATPANPETIAIVIGSGCGDATIIDNIFDPSYVSGAAVNLTNGTKLVACWGNRYSNGNHLPNLEDQSASAIFGNISVDGSVSATREVYKSGNLALGPNYNAPQTRYRLRMTLDINPGTYSAHIPAYLIRASTDDGKGWLALVTAVRSFTQSPPQLRVTLLEGSGLLYIPNLTYTGGTVDFAVIKSPTSANTELYSFTATQIGLTDKLSTTTWSAPVETNAAVLAGTAMPNVFPPLVNNGSGLFADLTVGVRHFNAVMKDALNSSINADDPDVEVDTSSGPVTVYLHTASGNAGLERTISNTGADTLTIQGSNSTSFSDGSSAYSVSPGESVTLKVNLVESFFLIL